MLDVPWKMEDIQSLGPSQCVIDPFFLPMLVVLVFQWMAMIEVPWKMEDVQSPDRTDSGLKQAHTSSDHGENIDAIVGGSNSIHVALNVIADSMSFCW